MSKESCVYRKDVKYGHVEIFGSASEAAQAARVEVVDIVRAIREGEELRFSTWKESKRWYLVKLKSGEVAACQYSTLAKGYVRMDQGPAVKRRDIVWVREVTHCVVAQDLQADGAWQDQG